MPSEYRLDLGFGVETDTAMIEIQPGETYSRLVPVPEAVLEIIGRDGSVQADCSDFQPEASTPATDTGSVYGVELTISCADGTSTFTLTNQNDYDLFLHVTVISEAGSSLLQPTGVSAGGQVSQQFDSSSLQVYVGELNLSVESACPPESAREQLTIETRCISTGSVVFLITNSSSARVQVEYRLDFGFGVETDTAMIEIQPGETYARLVPVPEAVLEIIGRDVSVKADCSDFQPEASTPATGTGSVYGVELTISCADGTSTFTLTNQNDYDLFLHVTVISEAGSSLPQPTGVSAGGQVSQQFESSSLQVYVDELNLSVESVCQTTSSSPTTAEPPPSGATICASSVSPANCTFVASAGSCAIDMATYCPSLTGQTAVDIACANDKSIGRNIGSKSIVSDGVTLTYTAQRSDNCTIKKASALSGAAGGASLPIVLVGAGIALLGIVGYFAWQRFRKTA